MKLAIRNSCLIILTLALVAQAQDKISLNLNLVPKTAYTLTMNMNQTVVQTTGGQDQKLENGTLIVYDYEILNRNKSGEAEVKLTYKRIKVNHSFGGQVTEYDSDNPPEFLDPSMKSNAALPGTILTLNIAPDGKVNGIKGVDELLNKMVAAMELPDNPQKEKVVANLRKQYGADALIHTFEQIVGFIPPHAVTVGNGWNSDINITTGFPMRIITDYTLKSRSAGIALIDVASQIKSDTATSKIKTGMVDMAYEISGTQNGTIKVDEATGLPINSELDMTYSGTVNVSGIPNQEAQSWPLSTTGTIIVTFDKK
jgi:hypothetical protein